MGAPVAAPAGILPVTLAEAKAYLRIGTGEEDALLAGLLRSAAATCEAFLGRLLIAREVEEVLPASAGWTRLGTGPVRAIEGVAGIGADGSAVPLPAETFATDIDAAGEGWVRLVAARQEKKLRVSYVAGLAADPNGVPEAVRCGIIGLAAHLYKQRDGAVAPPPSAVSALWRPWRRLRLS